MVNRKHSYRIYTEEKLQLKNRRKNKLKRSRMPLVVPLGTDVRWSVSLTFDHRSSGRSVFGSTDRAEICAQSDNLRQWNGVYEQGNVLLAKGIGCKAWIHTAWQADTERICGKSQWALSPRVFESIGSERSKSLAKSSMTGNTTTTMSDRTAHRIT